MQQPAADVRGTRRLRLQLVQAPWVFAALVGCWPHLKAPSINPATARACTQPGYETRKLVGSLGAENRYFDFDKLAEVTRVVTENLNKVGGRGGW